MKHRVHHGAVAARAFAKDPTLAGTTALKFFFNERHELHQQKIVPPPRSDRVDVLVASQSRETVGKRHNARRHRAFGYQPIKSLRDILGEILPARVRRPAGGEPDEVDKKGQSHAVAVCRDINVYVAKSQVAEHVRGEHATFDGQLMDAPAGSLSVRTHRCQMARVADATHSL